VHSTCSSTSEGRRRRGLEQVQLHSTFEAFATPRFFDPSCSRRSLPLHHQLTTTSYSVTMPSYSTTATLTALVLSASLLIPATLANTSLAYSGRFFCGSNDSGANQTVCDVLPDLIKSQCVPDPSESHPTCSRSRLELMMVQSTGRTFVATLVRRAGMRSVTTECVIPIPSSARRSLSSLFPVDPTNA
jgi:hypothetical protein